MKIIGKNGGEKAKKKSPTQAAKTVPSRATMMRIRDLKNGSPSFDGDKLLIRNMMTRIR